VIKAVHKAMSADYLEARGSFAGQISQVLRGNTNARLVSKVVMPIANHLISNFSNNIAHMVVY
jgi:hypothetical protein